LVLLLNLQACITGTALNAEKQRGIDADKALQEKNWPQAQIAYKAYIEGKGFGSLPKEIQFQALKNGAFVGWWHGDKNLGYSYLTQLVAMPQAGPADWIDLLLHALVLNQQADAARSLIVLAQRWPEQLRTVKDIPLHSALSAINGLPREAQLSSLWALYEANFKLNWYFEPNQAWYQLTLLLLEKDRLADAIDVSKRIDTSGTLLAMRADSRFDAVVAAEPAHFDILAAARGELRNVQTAADTRSNVLELKIKVISALEHMHDYGAMLAVTDELVSELSATNYPRRLYTDYDENYRWILNLRAVALERMERRDEAVLVLQAASRLKEYGGQNVIQSVNLAALLCRLGRPAEALAAVAPITNATEFGDVLLSSVKLDAEVQLEDAERVGELLEILRTLRAYRPMEYIRALILTNQMDLAAQSLIEYLMNPSTRGAALAHVQDFAPYARLAREREYDEQWQALTARSDVQATIKKIGRVESYRLELID
jgi:hypothetical protein